MSQASTVPTPQVDCSTLDDTLIVHGAFGLSGLYPLDRPEVVQEARSVQHCNMYFVRLTASEATREKNPIVTDKTNYVLRFHGETYENEAMCGVCLNRNCPANRNPQAEGGTWTPGCLVLLIV